MLTIEKLRGYGAEVDAGLGRCLNKEDFYLRMVNMLLQGKDFDRLEQALAEGNLKQGFAVAHSLKGTVGNLSLTPMYPTVCELTELLRHQSPGDYEGLMAALKEQLAELRTLAE